MLVNVLVEYSSGDSRYGKGLEDTLHNTEVGRAFMARHPEAAAALADDIENHARLAERIQTSVATGEIEAGRFQFSEALEEAQDLGYAEADPTADVEGFDAAAKAARKAGDSAALERIVAAKDARKHQLTEPEGEVIDVDPETGEVV